jgi:N-acyl-D-aspartate/D-glutamate deacylase
MRKYLPLLSILFATGSFAQQYDIVIEGGRVMDPESGLDAVRNVGILNGKIARITADPLAGKRMLNAKGLVVAPGFVDLHQHGQDLDSGRVKAFDGVTTALEMEIGAPDVAEFLAKKQEHSLINYGTSASHVAARALVFGAPLPAGTLLPAAGIATDRPATDDQIRTMKKRLRHELDAGAIGVGMGLEYTPGATRFEVLQIFRLAAERGVPVFVHIRSEAPRMQPDSGIESVGEVIGAAAVSGASLHIVHVNSMCMKDSPECLSMIAGARARGLDVTVEAYPYTAAMTYINSAAFNPGWREKNGIDYGDLQLPDRPDRLTKEQFEPLHASSKPQLVLMHLNPEELVDQIIRDPLVMIASDGAPGHPRNAGTFSRILARQVRQLGSLTLMDALRKMTLMPAQRMEKSVPDARRKGRLQEGADADVIAFDALAVKDNATYQAPMAPSTGMQFVIVNGTVLIDRAKLAPNTFPGKAL